MIRDLIQEGSRACGQCYPFAVKEAVRLAGPNSKGVVVVHGTIWDGDRDRRIPHGWIEHKGKAWDWQMGVVRVKPIATAEFYKIRKAKVSNRYPGLLALRLTTATGNYGPWTASERKQQQQRESIQDRMLPLLEGVKVKGKLS